MNEKNINLNKYYTNLLIKQYHDKPKAKATIELLIKNSLLLYTNILNKFIDSFNINTAIGKQLDIIGSIAGVDRTYNGIEGILGSMNDETYRILIKMKLINNYSMNSIKSIVDGVYNFLNDKLVFINNTDMTISYIIFEEQENSDIIKIITKNKNILPAPAGVHVNYVIRISNNKIFSFLRNKISPQEFVVGFSINDNLFQGTFLNNNNII